MSKVLATAQDLPPSEVIRVCDDLKTAFWFAFYVAPTLNPEGWDTDIVKRSLHISPPGVPAWLDGLSLAAEDRGLNSAVFSRIKMSWHALFKHYSDPRDAFINATEWFRPEGDDVAAQADLIARLRTKAVIENSDAPEKELADLNDPVQCVWVCKQIGKKAGRSDKLAQKMRLLGYPVVKAAGKNQCEREDAMRMFPRHRQRLKA